MLKNKYWQIIYRGSRVEVFTVRAKTKEKAINKFLKAHPFNKNYAILGIKEINLTEV